MCDGDSYQQRRITSVIISWPNHFQMTVDFPQLRPAAQAVIYFPLQHKSIYDDLHDLLWSKKNSDYVL